MFCFFFIKSGPSQTAQIRVSGVAARARQLWSEPSRQSAPVTQIFPHLKLYFLKARPDLIPAWPWPGDGPNPSLGNRTWPVAAKFDHAKTFFIKARPDLILPTAARSNSPTHKVADLAMRLNLWLCSRCGRSQPDNWIWPVGGHGYPRPDLIGASAVDVVE